MGFQYKNTVPSYRCSWKQVHDGIELKVFHHLSSWPPCVLETVWKAGKCFVCFCRLRQKKFECSCIYQEMSLRILMERGGKQRMWGQAGLQSPWRNRVKGVSPSQLLTTLFRLVAIVAQRTLTGSGGVGTKQGNAQWMPQATVATSFRVMWV